MSNPYINVYKNNPTAGGTDGTAISTSDTFTEPLTVTLDAAQSETAIVKLGIRTETGYQASDTTIGDLGDTNDRWKFSFSSDTGWADSITFTDTITTTNTIFYAKATSATTETPYTDRSVKLRVTSTIVAV